MSLTEARTRATQALSSLPDAEREAKWLLERVLALPADIWLRDPHQLLTTPELTRVEAALRRRERGEPLSRIVGEREFWSLSFTVTPATLDPRAVSETLVEAICRTYPHRLQPLRLLDLGTGSGCLLLSLLHEYPHAWGVGVDRSEAALQTARRNAHRLHLQGRAAFLQSNWLTSIEGHFDCILSNPPYIPSALIPTLATEVREYDPPAALDGGPDGLEAYRLLAPACAKALTDGGHLFWEVGEGQALDVKSLLGTAGLHIKGIYSDIAGIPRVVHAQR